MDKLALQQHNLHDESSEVCINARSPAASQPYIGLVAEQTTVNGLFVGFASDVRAVRTMQ